MCCWNTNRVDAVTRANEELFDDNASTTSTSLLNTMFEVLWPTMVAPVILEQMKKQVDLGENSKGYTLRIASGTLANLRLQFTHIGVVKTATATAKQFYERSIRTWTPNDVRAWLRAGLSMTEERMAELKPLLEKWSFNGASLAACTTQELEKSFKFTKEESLKIITMRDKYESSGSVKQMVDKIVDAARSASSRSDAGGTDAKEEPEKGGILEVAAAAACSVANFDVGINLSGSPSMEILLENESSLMANMEADVQKVNLDAKVRVEIDPTNEEVRIAFFEKPEIDLDIDIELGTLGVPLFGESRWLEEIIELVLEDFSLDNPIKIPLGNVGGASPTEDTKRSIRRAF